MTGSTGSPMCAVLSVMAVAWAPIIFGMSLGFTGPAINVMQDTTMVNGEHVSAPKNLVVFAKTTDTTSSEGSLFSSIVNIGCLLGALMGSPMMEILGRKPAILILSPMFVVSWLFTGLLSSYGALIACRFLCGLAVGISSAVVPTYINEVAPPSLRGALGAVFQMAITIGIMMAYLLGAYAFRTSYDGHSFCQWRLLAYSVAVPSALLLVCGSFVPESPGWLASKGRMEEARTNLSRLRGGECSGQELSELNGSASGSERAAAGFGDLLKNSKVMIIGFMLMLLQQFSGVNAVIFYQNTIFQDAKMSNPEQLGFLVMVLQMVMTAVSIPLIDTAGRRALLMTALAGMAVCCGAMFVFFLKTSPSWLAIVGSFAYIAFFSIGLGPVPWLMMGEIFPQHIRSLASSCAACFNWTLSFVVTESIGSMTASIGLGGVFACYGTILVLGFLYVFTSVPETKGKSLAELEHILGISRNQESLIALSP